MNFARFLIEADQKLFYIINTKLSFTGLDNAMLLFRQPYTWVPLYLFFLLFFYTNCRRYFVPVIALSLVTFAFTDFTSASILKPLIGRLRPCHDPSLPFSVNNLAGCGGFFSMPSSHAANHFGLAAFWFYAIKETVNSKWYWLWLWAFLIGYSQIYAGVHYPGDIIAGALLGVGIGLFICKLFNNWVMKINSGIATGL